MNENKYLKRVVFLNSVSYKKSGNTKNPQISQSKKTMKIATSADRHSKPPPPFEGSRRIAREKRRSHCASQKLTILAIADSFLLLLIRLPFGSVRDKRPRGSSFAQYNDTINFPAVQNLIWAGP